MSEKNIIQKRQTACWAVLGELNGGVFSKGEEGSAYRTKEGHVFSRVNVFGIVLSKESTEFFESIVIDDSTGSINAKSFDKKGIFDNVDVGDVINIIGRMREYNQAPFISVELVRKGSQEAFSLRKKEIGVVKRFYSAEKESSPVQEEEVVQGSSEQITGLIKSLDSGNGADIEEVIRKCGIKNAGEVVKDLLRNGEVFENMPGRIKVLD